MHLVSARCRARARLECGSAPVTSVAYAVRLSAAAAACSAGNGRLPWPCWLCQPSLVPTYYSASCLLPSLSSYCGLLAAAAAAEAGALCELFVNRKFVRSSAQSVVGVGCSQSVQCSSPLDSAATRLSYFLQVCRFLRHRSGIFSFVNSRKANGCCMFQCSASTFLCVVELLI